MTFTKEPPTRRGFYAWRTNDQTKPGFYHLINVVNPQSYDGVGGEWCELVPRDEVVPNWEIEKAYEEGLKDFNSNSSWTYSRAKRVMEGKE